VKTLAGILVVVIPATWLAWAAIPSFIRQTKAGRRAAPAGWFPRSGGGTPTQYNELRFWASVWLVIAAAILAVELALGPSQ
jgi:hypothetical protein